MIIDVRRLAFIFIMAAITILACHSNIKAEPKPEKGWLSLETGLELGSFAASKKSEVGDSIIHVLRIDPKNFAFHLFNAQAEDKKKPLPAWKWAQTHHLVATINASMYQADHMTSVSFMRTQNHVNNTWVSKDKMLLVFDPTDPSLPPVQIIDRDCRDFSKIRTLYKTLIQSIRMVSCHGENVWAPQSKKWSTAAIGTDNHGRILFMHVRSPYTTHDLTDILLELPIGLQQAMYVEGGPEAQLYINTGKHEHQFIGSYSTGSFEHDENDVAWPLPNVVGIRRIANSKN
ncbi:MAG: phosphodiester glycosidase family protein [Nitrospinae bacterium]|nr:phosphodiester glycosidase family protein [Nitrospinota bacterium]